jgi:GNAT superfamily N-acetyltransferase
VITTRRASTDDIEAMLGHVQAGLDSYVAFASLGWRPPRAEADRQRSLRFLADPDTWALVAVADSSAIGHVAFVPAREHAPSSQPADLLERPVIPGLAHVWRLFVLPDWWGRGVAPLLHDAAIAEMRARGYERGRLFTPSLQARARRFYERRGWRSTEEQWNDDFQLMMTEYRIALAPNGG